MGARGFYMSRLSNNKRCLFLLSALTAALLWLAPARSGRAAAYTYNARQRTINAGVLFVGSASDLAFPSSAPNSPTPVPDPAPYVFYVLDQRPDAKPVGWSFVNPLAQSTVSTAMSTRWGGAYSVGDSLRPTMASYWEVALRDVSADDLQQFDVLYLVGSYVVGSNSVPLTITPADNEKLRRFVDGGGQLIVEYGVGTGSQPQRFGFLTPFNGTTWAAGTVGTASLLAPPTVSGGLLDLHPLFTQPNFLQASDLTSLGASSPDGSFGMITEAASGDLFSQVLLQGGGHGVDAAQLGGGQVISSALNLGPTISISRGAFFASGPFFVQAPYFNALFTSYSPSVVPSADLKFLSNAISWADTHPTENKTSHQNAAGPSSASFTAAWSYPLTSNATTPPPSAAIYGNFIYVTDAAGTLHAFDAIPSEGLTGMSADDGIQDFSNTTVTPPATPYDEIWSANVRAGASAPTVASYGGATYVFVETANGSVQQFSSLNTTAAKTYTAPGTTLFSGHAPAPTYYDGRIYAGQPDGTMFVIALSGSGSAAGGVIVPVDPTTGGVNSSGSATASPAVGLLESGPVSNSIVALVPTTQNMNTVLLGARNDPLSLYNPNGQFGGFNVNRLARYSLFNLFVDAASSPAGRAYDSNGNNGVTITGSRDPVFLSNTLPANVDDYFGDWDSDFAQSTMQGGNAQAGLTLHEIKALSLSNTAGGGATLSAPAIDRHGDYYYVVNAGDDSYLFGVHDDIAQRNVRIKFRFRLPKMGDISTVNPTGGANWGNPGNAFDADNVNYNDPSTKPDGALNSLTGYHFVGAPVVDGQGNVYVAAQNGSTVAVLAFSGDQEVTANPQGNPTNFDATQARYFQIDESMGNPQNPLVAIPSPGRGAARYGQLTTAGTLASVFNFGRGSGGSRQIAGNLCEPQPFTATPSGPNSGTAMWMYFHTNLSWYTTFLVNGQISGVSKAGSTLLLCDSGLGGNGSYNTLYKLPATPTIGAGKVAALTVRRAPLGTSAGGKPLDVGTVTAAPSAGGGAMVVNGSAGVAAFNQQLTLIADNNRILEADADGNAVWSADATTRVGANGSSTKVDFAHPAALSQFAANDYLVADTGNNRCVRFDRGANVTWELTRFYDPSGLMAPGQPYTLSQPTSVEVRREFFQYPDPGTLQNPGNQQPITGQIVHYLIADTGNDRIVEVTDTLDAGGNLLYFNTATPAVVVAPGTANSVTHDHLLTWVTHTGDKYGRRYQYAGASYLTIPGATQTIEVFALVTNTRLAAPTQVTASPLVYALGAASGDAPGGSIIAFNLPVAAASSLGPKPFNMLGPNDNDIQYVATSYTANTTGGSQTLPVRNPRFLHVYAPPQASPTATTPYQYSLLYTDSNGAFDLVYTGATTPLVSYGLAFTQADYQKMTIPADAQDNIPTRGGAAAVPGYPKIPPIPFVPTCVQRLNDDETNRPNINHIERYLITQSYSQGELGTLLRPALPLPPAQPNTPAIRKVGGEIFEVDVSTPASGNPTVDPVGGFAGAVTLSHPVGASPLTQPTSAIRTAQ